MSGACAAAALTSVTVLAAGCSGSGQAAAPGRAAAPPPAASAATAAVTGGTPGSLEALGDRYLAIAVPANHRLDDEVNGFAAHQRTDLAAAEADLRAQAATERWFDQRLAAIPFPPAIAAMARALVGVNQLRAALTRQEARSASLAALRSWASQHRAADADVEFGVRLIRQALGLPPPSSS
jgi:hypothetical protein